MQFPQFDHPVTGIAVPVGALKSARSCGTGEFRDLEPLADLCKKTGLDITAYSLRHAAALLLLRRGADAFTVQNILGHATMQMTKHYLALTLEDTRKGHQNAGVMLSILGQESSKPVRMRKINV